MNSLENNFCGTWGCSQYETESFNMPPLALENNSIRQIIKVSVGGKQIRLRFSNICGESELELKSVHFAVSEGNGKIVSKTDKTICFNSDESILLPAHSEIYSDVFDYELNPLTEYAITIYYGKVPEKVTGHPGSRTTSYEEVGNCVTKVEFSSEYVTDHWYTIAGIEVVNDKKLRSVVCLGDSITDGRGTTTNKQNRWTDVLAERLQKNDGTRNIAVINQGIGGTCITYSGVNRFEQDVLNQKGIAYLIILYGINDIVYAHCNAEQIINTYKDFIKRAHEQQIKVYGGTILPFGKCKDWTPETESVRLEVNAWIRNQAGKKEGFDAFIEFANTVRNGDKEELPEANENDGLHPTAELYKIMGQTPLISLFVD